MSSEGRARDVKAEVRIPVAVKLGPYFSSMANMAQKLDATGVNGLVLFNRFYQPDYDLESLEDVVAIPLGAFADPAFPHPVISVDEDFKHPWVDLPFCAEHMG